MIRSAVREHRFGAAALAVLGSVGLLILACETPTPPSVEQDAPSVLEEGAPAVLDVAPVAENLAVAGDGYFLVKKTGETLDYIGPVSGDKLEMIREDGEDMAFGVLVKKVGEDGAVVPSEEGEVFRVREVEQGNKVLIRSNSAADAPKPLIVIDGVISDDPDALETIGKENIQRVEVIKGTKAIEIYGEQGANGVIKIFTKG